MESQEKRTLESIAMALRKNEDGHQSEPLPEVPGEIPVGGWTEPHAIPAFPDEELVVIHKCWGLLQSLSPRARMRVVNWLACRAAEEEDK